MSRLSLLPMLCCVVCTASAAKPLGKAPAGAPQGAERHLTAAVIIAEAGGEGQRTMEGVYEVIHTRVSQWRHGGYWGTLIHKFQFSCLNGVAPEALIKKHRNHKNYAWVYNELLKFPPLTNHTVPPGHVKSSVNRADHFHDTSMVPYWSRGYRWTEIGRIRFYRLR